MAIMYTTLAVLLATAVTFALTPYAFRLLGRTIGRNIRSRTQQRRELLLRRAAAEEQEAHEHDAQSAPATKLPESTSSDEDWESVADGKTPPSAPPLTPPPPSNADFAGVIAFFHPFCNAGGGGERVLFAALLATQHRYPRALCIVYTGDHAASKAQILANARTRFNIALAPARICFLYLGTRDHVLASRYPRFTLLGQSLGSLVLGWDAVTLLAPDVLVDTMGYAFALALSKWLFPAVPTAAYVHYPTISTDMLASLSDEVSGRGLNAGLGKGLRGRLKHYYWRLFAKLYSRVGGSVDVVMTNSTWTQNHITRLWAPSRRRQGKTHPITVLYPPCAVAELEAKIPLNAASEQKRTRNILYIAQFRPEKMHHLIIDAFHAYLLKHHNTTNTNTTNNPSPSSPPPPPQPKLILIGSVRDASDEKLVYKLRLQAQTLKPLGGQVDFVINAPWPAILTHLATASVGVNAMWNEHFGIGVVEYQAAGLVAVVNDSGGPKVDIVVPVDGEATGFLASGVEGFADAFEAALGLGGEEGFAMRVRARRSAGRFSEEVFARGWVGRLEGLVELRVGWAGGSEG
ncbi:hypothetical protein LTR08_003304 [Meristemomyces frigidus]|nr:hypothetical protein LTR08_003304 [Meristemomyces frigidus]